MDHIIQKSKQGPLYSNKRVLLLTHTLIFKSCEYCLHSFHTCTLHNSETLEPLTWIRVLPSNCCERTLKPSHVLYCHYWISVNIQHSNQLLVLSFCISTLQCVSPYFHWLNMTLLTCLPNLAYKILKKYRWYITIG